MYKTQLVNVDTDSISFQFPDGLPATKENRKKLLEEVNALMPNMISFDDDGFYPLLLVVKAKNYVMMKENGDFKYKGSSIRDQKKEPALREMMELIIKDIMLNDSKGTVDIYTNYIKEAMNIQDISRWCTKKTVTKTLMTSTRLNETKVVKAFRNRIYQEGDKVWLFNDINSELTLQEDFSGSYDKMHYVKRVHTTMEIFKGVLDITQFTKYHLKKNIPILEAMCVHQQALPS